MELSFYWLITFLGSEKWENHLGDSSSCNTFNVLDMCRILIGFISDEGVTLSSAHFFFSIYMTHPPHSLYFILADLRERKLVAFDFVDSSFTSISLSVVILKVVLLQKAYSFFTFLLIAE